jgi:hypothetical protein
MLVDSRNGAAIDRNGVFIWWTYGLPPLECFKLFRFALNYTTCIINHWKHRFITIFLYTWKFADLLYVRIQASLDQTYN